MNSRVRQLSYIGKIQDFLKKRGHLVYGVKYNALISLFAKEKGYTIPNGVGYTEWITDLYLSGNDPDCKRKGK